ncbi:hypothetical protein C2845_PM16G05320 [Panicum miliaceum]|uniref:Enoyl reductase (ER) domain-containing protein n=1 Tax=Panicum miliaceum TaxID=4540 RepID=A0A3L6PUI9_PANMI|nr:hypothetical protein C2845_PM16G05320 [Panicum miliaceum]
MGVVRVGPPVRRALEEWEKARILGFIDFHLKQAFRGEAETKVATGSSKFCMKVIEDFVSYLIHKNDMLKVTDVAGVVAEVGSGVKRFKAGGGLAEYAVASVKLAVRRPPGVSAADGAGLPIAAGTALQSLRSIGARFDGAGSKPLNVLVTAASGGVGHYAVQLAKLAGLHVTATCGARNAELVRGLGADEVLDYGTPEGAGMRSPSGRLYDGVVHCTVGVGWPAFEPLLSAAGKVVDITASFSAVLTAARHRVTFARKRPVPLLLWPNRGDMEFLVGLVKDGKLKTVVDSRSPLRDVSEAWEKSIGGHATGKIVVRMEG